MGVKPVYVAECDYCQRTFDRREGRQWPKDEEMLFTSEYAAYEVIVKYGWTVHEGVRCSDCQPEGVVILDMGSTNESQIERIRTVMDDDWTTSDVLDWLEDERVAGNATVFHYEIDGSDGRLFVLSQGRIEH